MAHGDRGVYGLYFKALELRGFKSFPERTVLTFDKPLTAIVGPNGSGKSNIADAIQWVMGEQSTRALRGGKMEDVIFGGTARRSQVGFAEVSLTLDNSDHRLGGELNEVQVTRRYYRSGESEYYINKKPVRLKDINELFMDTGLGRDGYSIIGQGKIDSILSAKSTDRREIFEEAAGISRFRHRKEESERKLQRAEEDLTRVNDKIGELELQVEPLRRQSETAKRYLVLRDELRGLEISLWMYDLEAIAERLEALDGDALKAAGAIERAKLELDKLYAAGEGFAQRTHDKDVEAEGVRAKITDLEKRASDEDAQAAVLKSDLQHTQDNVRRIQEEMATREGRSLSLTEQIDERQKRIAEIGAQCEALAAGLEELRLRAEKLLSGEGDFDKEVSRLTREASDTADALSDRRVELSGLESTQKELTQRAEGLQWELTDQRERLAASEREAENNQKALQEARDKALSLQNVSRGYSLRVEGLSKKYETAGEKRTALQMEYNAVLARIQMLSDMEREYEGYSKAVKVVMREAERGVLRGVHGPAGELVKAPEKYAVAIETALGAAVQNIIVSTENDGKNAINLLKRTDAGRVTLLPMNVIRGTRLAERGLEDEDGFEGVAFDLVTFEPQYRDIYPNLLGRTAVAGDMDSAIRIARKFSHRFRIVTLDGQVVNAGGSMTGGSAARNTGILSRANELEKLKARQQKAGEELEKAKDSAEETKRALAAAEYELSVAGEELRAAENDVLKLTSTGEHFELLRSSLKDRLDKIEAESQGVAYRFREAGERASALKDEIEALEQKSRTLKERLDEFAGDREKLNAQREEIARAEAEKRESRASLEAEAAGAERTVEELTRLRAQLAGDREGQERQLVELEAKGQAIREEIGAHEDEAASLRAGTEKLRERVARIAEEKLAIEAERARSDKQLQEKNAALLDLEREAAKVDNRMEAARMEERQILDKLWNGYELTRSDAMAQRMELPNIPQAKRRTGELKREMGSLGTPNLGAIEEFERVNTRYTYLTDQRDDIEKAKRELLGIIGEITGSMETIFKEELERIDLGFRQTFLELFGGGQASVSLEDPEDILGSGIEIRVQPPGKTLKTITLLSGGEKAFVAIALYFAILKVRPTPFVVMDEIEAALDDANVVKVAEYMRGLTEKTQFLTITHRRGTMEEADVLYGVTMQEQGVSKVLVIDLDEAEKTMGKKDER